MVVLRPRIRRGGWPADRRLAHWPSTGCVLCVVCPSCPQALIANLQAQLSLLKVCRGTTCHVRDRNLLARGAQQKVGEPGGLKYG